MKLAPGTRRVVLAVALLATLAAVVWASRIDVPGSVATVSPRRETSNAAARRTPEAGTMAVLGGVRVEKLRVAETASRPAGDAFRSKSFYVPPPPPKLAPPPPPSAPPLPFNYVGMLREQSGVTIFLANGERLHSVQVGDVIDDNYRIEAITPQGVEFLYLPMNTLQSLRIENPS